MFFVARWLLSENLSLAVLSNQAQLRMLSKDENTGVRVRLRYPMPSWLCPAAMLMVTA